MGDMIPPAGSVCPHTGIGGFPFMIVYQTGGIQEEIMLQTGTFLLAEILIYEARASILLCSSRSAQ